MLIIVQEEGGPARTFIASICVCTYLLALSISRITFIYIYINHNRMINDCNAIKKRPYIMYIKINLMISLTCIILKFSPTSTL